MSFHNYLKKSIKTALFVGFICNTPLIGQEITDLSRTEQALVSDALEKIHHERNNKKGSLERVTCCYKPESDGTVSASVKTFYLDYRKTTDYQRDTLKKTSSFPGDLNETVAITYKPTEKNQLTIVVSKKNKSRNCKHITIS